MISIGKLKHGRSIHDLSNSRVYRARSTMLQRCYNRNEPAYSDYGGRGIKVCIQWRLSFEEFFHDMGEPGKGMSLERRDNNGNYTPDNCYWATRKQQERNKRSNRMITFKGKTQCLSAWAEELQMSMQALFKRLFKYGWSVEASFTIPVKKYCYS